jgi:hypothetical protein
MKTFILINKISKEPYVGQNILLIPVLVYKKTTYII